MWRNTQVWLKGPVLKTGRSETARGFESLFLRHLYFRISRDGAVRQLVGLITQRSLVQIQLPQPFWSRGVAVITSACHAEDREFDSRRDRHLASQLSRQSRGLKILVSAVRFCPKPPSVKTINSYVRLRVFLTATPSKKKPNELLGRADIFIVCFNSCFLKGLCWNLKKNFNIKDFMWVLTNAHNCDRI